MLSKPNDCQFVNERSEIHCEKSTLYCGVRNATESELINLVFGDLLVIGHNNDSDSTSLFCLFLLY